MFNPFSYDCSTLAYLCIIISTYNFLRGWLSDLRMPHTNLGPCPWIGIVLLFVSFDEDNTLMFHLELINVYVN